MRSIIVIGGGFIGAAAALRLQEAGVQVTLIDPGDKRRAASFGNAGHIGVEQTAPWSAWRNVWRAPASSFAMRGPLDFRWSDVALWSPWAMDFLQAAGRARFVRGQEALTALLADAMPAWLRIAQLAGAPEIVIPHGHVTAWTTPRAAEAGVRAMHSTSWGAATWREMSAGELAAYSAVLRAAPCAGVRFSGTGQVSEPQAARDALMKSFVDKGGEVIAAKAARIDAGSGVFVSWEDKTLEADAVLIAAGAWSRALIAQLGVRAPLIGERGYSVQSAEHNWPTDLPTTVFEENFVVLSRFVSGLRATSFLEFGNPDAPGDERKWRLLESRIAQLGIKFSKTPDRWVGPRPTLPDYLPAIGRLERKPNVLYAFGHQHLGLTMSAINAEIVTALATDQRPPVDLGAFKIERFA